MRPFCHIVLLLCSVWVSTTAVSAQDFVGGRPAFEGGDNVLAPPSPTRIEDFEFSYSRSPGSAETSVQVAWRRVSFAEEYRVYRQVLQLVTTSDHPGTTVFLIPEASLVSLNGWSLLRTLDFNNANSFLDSDVPPLDMSEPPAGRRPLGMAYCYRIEASGNGSEALSPVICTRLRGINTPVVQSVTVRSAEEIELVWEDESEMELGFKITYRQAGDGAKQTVTLLGANRNRFVLSGLLPDTEYCVAVQSFDFYGTSAPGYIDCVQTGKSPGADPGDQTFTVHLQKDDVYSENNAHIPYEGRFPTTGPLPSGILTRVQSVNGFPFLRFVKPGHGTQDCDQADAVVQLNPGDELSAADLMTLFESETPALPVYFLACAGQSQQLFNWIPINISYQKD